MTSKEILEGNRLIAEFMELELAGPGIPLGYFYKNKYLYFNELKYHSSWDWLIPAITKCKSLNIDHSEWTNMLYDGLMTQDKEMCWVACVEFIYECNNEKI